MGQGPRQARKAAPATRRAAPAASASLTVTVEMTDPQRDAYAGQYGTGFVALEVAGRLRPELDDAMRRVTWLRWLADNATVTISEPRPQEG